jgi:TPR repeat protein
LLGVGLVADEREAVSWYRKAADLGQADAQYNLGSCYDAGVGVETDKVEAKSWYQKAANQGHKGALVSLQC